MALKRKDPGRAYSPARKALSRSGLGSCRSPRRGLSTSFQASNRPVTSARPTARHPVIRPGGGSTVKGSCANMKVVVRVRPLSQRERENNSRIIVDVVDEKMVVFDPKKEEESFFFQGVKQTGRDMLKKQNKNTKYLFDRVFGSEASNEEVFEGSTKSIVTSVLDGFNCSVFVYGATGAGKTFTMLGTQENPGITFRTMVDLFKQIEEQRNEKDFDIGVSYLEVYNETVKDLLNPASGALYLREDGGGVMVAGLKLERITDPEKMFDLLELGNKNRAQDATAANAESSRSHAVFQVFLKMKTKCNGQTKMVKLSMIDLAGSERGAATGCAGARFKEGSNINKSLLALGNCINALADGLRHIPFRDSKLTRLLKDSLGGNCQTVMIANVSPAHHTYEDSHNTLKYATRAKSIKFQIKRNIVSVELHVSHYIKMVEDLQAENERLKKELEESKALNEATASGCKPEPQPSKPCMPAPSHLPPVVAAAVAAISNKMKVPVSTSTVAVNTSPPRRMCQNEELKRVKDAVEKLYNEKARIHQRYLNMDSSDKVLRWRIKMKQRTIDRVQAMSSTPSRTDLAQLKVEKSVDQFKGRLHSVNECQEVVSLEESEINQRLSKLREEALQSAGFDEVASHLNSFELQFQNQVLLLKCQHLEKLVEYLDCGFESHDEVLRKVSNLFRTYYNLVRGHGHMNEELMKEHEAVMRGLEGMKSVQWRQERDQIYFTDPRIDDVDMPPSPRPCIQYVDNGMSTEMPVLTVLPLPALSGKVLNNEQAVLLQSPLCSSSSQPSEVHEAMDTASMLGTLEDLDVRVDNILNTSVSSMVVETGSELFDTPITSDKDRPLNVTFEGESNLNSTFVKEDPGETKVNLDETFEKPDGELGIQKSGRENLNGTFSLDDIPSDVDAATQNATPPASSHETSSVSKCASPLLVGKGSPYTVSAQSPSKLVPYVGLAKKNSPSMLRKPSPSHASVAKKSSPSGALNPPTLKKLGTTVSSPTFAVPAAVPAKSAPSLRKAVGAGIIDKRKALGPNAVPFKQPGTKLLSINRKIGSSNPKTNLNTPSKVKLAWNKENRNANTVTSFKPGSTIKSVVTAAKKPIAKPPTAPMPLNDTFTK